MVLCPVVIIFLYVHRAMLDALCFVQTIIIVEKLCSIQIFVDRYIFVDGWLYTTKTAKIRPLDNFPLSSVHLN